MVDYTMSVALFYHNLFHSEIPNFDLSPLMLSTVFYFYSSTNWQCLNETNLPQVCAEVSKIILEQETGHNSLKLKEELQSGRIVSFR